MDISLIKAFVVLAAEKNYRIAAEKRFMTQSTLTKKIQRLEKHLNTALFDRGRHGAQLTQAGKVLLPQAQKLVRQSADFEHLAKEVAQGAIGHLNVGFGVSTYHLAPAFIADFSTQHPKVHITLNDTPSSLQFDALLSGHLQLSFNRVPDHHALHHLPLAKDQLALVIHNDLTDDLSWGTLGRYPYLALNTDRGPGLATQIHTYFSSLNIALATHQQADDILTLVSLVAAKIGFCLLPISAQTIAPSEVAFIPLDGPHTHWPIGLVWNAEFDDPVRDRFVSELQQWRNLTRVTLP